MIIDITIKGGARVAAIALACAGMAACDVTNPGPVQDEFLAVPQAQQGLVNGAIRRLAEAVSWEAYTTALAAREIFPGGQTGAHGHDVLSQAGYIRRSDSYGGYFNDAQQARYIAETAITRFTEAKAPNTMMYQAHLWAAYAYRNLGENWCEAVIDGGPLQPGRVYFDKAIENFAKALTFAATDTDRRQVYGGRAAAYAWLNDWAKVTADAALVPDAFVFNINLDQTDQDYENHLYFAQANSPYRAYTIWKTWFETYYTQTGDPRTPWGRTSQQYANASLQGYGQVPFTIQQKYKTRNDDQRLTSGWEMRLLEAEAKLIANDIPGAMTLINRVRTRNVSATTNQPLAPWSATTLDQAWSFLKRERMIELWLEGRRLGDQRRWEELKRPGSIDLPDFESVSPIFKENPRSLCFEIPDSERNSNPNF
jgi:starch-binding outer membrane protein, SusD/RagB family